jgi:hypothetical protein
MLTIVPREAEVQPQDLGWKQSLSEIDKSKIRYRYIYLYTWSGSKKDLNGKDRFSNQQGVQ